jgi:tetratricopeptide (TPR) repeat protein/uncharacterized protein (AIM24 family)
MTDRGDDSSPASRPRLADDRRPLAPAEPAWPGPLPPDTIPPESEPVSASFDSEDFLFHLYRGSELLADNCVSEAKDELEKALRSQPRDPEGQGLLGIVYFRLGMFPQAIRIYQELMQSFPGEVTPKVNAALCFLKTGQTSQARELLEQVIQREPEHKRAWGYLGLALERLGDLEQAKAAYERAAQPQRVRRLEQRTQPAPPAAQRQDQSSELRQAAAEAVREIEDHPVPFFRAEDSTRPSYAQPERWRSVELGRAPPSPPPRAAAPSPQALARPVLAAAVKPARAAIEPSAAEPTAPEPPPSPRPAPSRSPAELADAVALLLPAQGMRADGDTLVVVRVEPSAAVRLRAARLLLPQGEPFRCTALRRRSRGQELSEPLGGVTAPIGLLEGAGHAVLAAEPGRVLRALHLQDRRLYLRESRLVAFESTIHYENGRLARSDAEPLAMVQLSGCGQVLVETHAGLRSVQVGAGPAVTVEADRVLGWYGRLLPRATPPEQAPGGMPSYVGFVGEGTLLLELLG